MSMHLGYAIGSAIFIGIFAVAVAAQIAAKSFHPFLYWAVIIATTTAGTTMADFADRSLGIGYAASNRVSSLSRHACREESKPVSRRISWRRVTKAYTTV
jgi:uncharacterized membrane-anchored protein